LVAGGQVPLNDQKLDELVHAIEMRFLDVMGDQGPGESLV